MCVCVCIHIEEEVLLLAAFPQAHNFQPFVASDGLRALLTLQARLKTPAGTAHDWIQDVAAALGNISGAKM